VAERRLWLRWVAWVTVGEAVGFTAPALVGVITAAYSPAVSVPALLAAGAVEGAVLGAAQARVLRDVVTKLSRRRWTVATSCAAVLAYLIALTPSAASGLVGGLPVAVLVLAAAVLGPVLLLSIGFAQWLVLRAHVAGAARWIWVTAAAWLVGLTVFMVVATPLWHEGRAIAVTVLIGVGAGLLMAAAVAAVTGLGVVWIHRAGRAGATYGGTARWTAVNQQA
jgi:hypothetical protein